MASNTFGAEQAGTGVLDDTDLPGSNSSGGAGGGTMQRPAPTSAAPGGAFGGTSGGALGEGVSAVREVAGEEVQTLPTSTVEALPESALHQEVGSAEGAESGEEFMEATPEQLAAAESGEESAISDLRSEGYTEGDAAESGAEAAAPLLRDAGTAIESAESSAAQAEFLPILASLVPTLVSTVGPMVARAVSSRLSPRAQQVVRRIAARPAAPPRPGAPAGMSNVLAMIARLLQQAQQGAARTGREGAMESGMEGEAIQPLVAEAVAALEAIVDVDDRVRITNTTAVPWRRICALRIEFPTGAVYRGTGFLIGPRALATAGHCVYLHNQGGWARRVEIIPGANGASAPLGRAESRMFRSVAGWVSHRKPESDYGCIMLPSNAFGGRNLGSFGFAAFDARTLLAQRAVVAGYPGDKPFAELWGAARRLKTVTAKTLVYNTATMGGQSGAPVYVKRGGDRYVVGIHNYGSSTGNSATRITQSVMARLVAWSKL